MGLTEILRQRTAVPARTGEVDCGALGRVTVEALPPREWEELSQGPDGARAVFYAACRELQSAGETLRREGSLFRPDEVMQFVTDDEAEEAARIVAGLSADSERRPDFVQSSGTDFGEVRLSPVQDLGLPDGEFRPGSVQTVRGEVRPGSVQDFREEVRHESVQGSGTDFSEIRHGFVQAGEGKGAGLSGDGQVSREFLPGKTEMGKPTDVSGAEQAVVEGSANRPQGLGASGEPDRGGDVTISEKGSGKRQTYRKNRNFQATNVTADLQPTGSEAGEALHETESAFGKGLHESESHLHEAVSEMQGTGPVGLHETESGFPEALHEIESESGAFSGKALHEIESSFGKPVHETESHLHESESAFSGTPGGTVHETASSLHETESPFGKGLHEMESEPARFPGQSLHEIESGFPEGLHETESETAERLAWALLEGLRRAAAVR